MSNSKGRPHSWGKEVDIVRARVPVSIMAEIDYIRDQITDPVKAERHIVELLSLNTSKISLKLYDTNVSATPGIAAVGNSSYEAIEVPKSILKRPKKSFLLRVSGDSMEDVGIHHGDIVAVEKFEGVPNDREIVLAYINDGEQEQIVIKEYREYKYRYELQSRNRKKEYLPIRISKNGLGKNQFMLEEQRTVKIFGIFDTVIPESWINF